jgi:LmbE family N-acetylglucosaminyl deacetylase
MIEYTAVNMFADTADEDTGVVTTKAEHEAAYQATLDAATAEANRKKRNELLAETDYLALTDNTLNDITTQYRQALRDITTHESWPHLSEADWPTAP